jgi:hypothetical protein
MALPWRPPRRHLFWGNKPASSIFKLMAPIRSIGYPFASSIRAVSPQFNGHGFMKGRGHVRRTGGLGP